MRTTLLVSLLASTALAQSNTQPGLEGRLTDAASPTYFGRRGAAYPNGEIGMSYSYTICNPGTVAMPWAAPMDPRHPKFAFMVVRESNGRMEQITNSTQTYVKHAFAASNSISVCGPCQTTGGGLRVGCSDTYGASTNANRFYLGPASEIDPWTGIWTAAGSYFDRGEPDVGPPANSDSVRSLLSGTSGVFATDPVLHRVTLREQDLLVPGRLFQCMHVVVEAEDGDAHFDNMGHRELTATWNGTTWAFGNSGVPFTGGSVLAQWAGATIGIARNGEDDGHFVVASKVTALGNGMWHYEYVVQNFDNARGGAALHIPICPSVQVANVGFRDVDQDALNDWTWTRLPAELMFAATATNPLDWNTMFNFWFDASQPPAAGPVEVDEARTGAGALAIGVTVQLPAGVAANRATGAGCGSPLPTITANGLPTIPNPAFAITMQSDPGAYMWLFYSWGPGNVVVAPGCTVHLDPAQLVEAGVYGADGVGVATAPFPIPSLLALEGVELFWQAAQLVTPGPVFGAFTIGNSIGTLGGCR